MKYILSVAAIGWLINTSSAQSIPNAGFETWHNYTVPQPLGLLLEVPNTWSGLDSILISLSPMASLSGFGYDPHKQVYKSTDAHSGTYAAEIKTVDLGGILGNVPAMLSNGKPKLDILELIEAQPENFEGVLELLQFEQGTPITQRVEEVSAWVKMGANSVDEGAIIAIVAREENGEFTILGSNIQPVDRGQTDYAEVKVPVEYYSEEVELGNEPNSLIVIFLSSSTDNNSGIFTHGNTMFVDDVSFTYVDSTVSIKLPMFALTNFQAFPNPAKDRITLVNKGTQTVAGKLVVTDIAGRSVANEDLLPSGNVLHVNGWAKGLYHYVVQDENGAGVQSGKFVVE